MMAAPDPMPAAVLQRRLAAGDRLTVLDIRTASDRAEWWIEPSLHVDAYGALKRDEAGALDGVALPAGAPVVAVCGAGVTARTAAGMLAARGLEAFFLEGGMRAWSSAWNTAEVPDMAHGTTVLQVRRTGKGCLSYVIASGGEALVVDASVESAVYESIAGERGWRITRVIDTHIHADHVTRGRALADAHGARYHLGRTTRARFPHAPLQEGDQLLVGDARLDVLATPGHTLESMSFVLDGRALLTGDTLFLDGVGRPDLEASSAEAEARAVLLHGSLNRLLGMAGHLMVLPGHTARPVAFDGVALTRSLAEVRGQDASGVLARWFNPDAPSSAGDFARWILGRLPAVPPNHRTIVALNEAGESVAAFDLTELEAGANRCAVR